MTNQTNFAFDRNFRKFWARWVEMRNRMGQNFWYTLQSSSNMFQKIGTRRKFCSIQPFLLGSSFSDRSWMIVLFWFTWKTREGNGFAFKLAAFNWKILFYSAPNSFETSNQNVLPNGKCPLMLPIFIYTWTWTNMICGKHIQYSSS